MIKFIKKRWKLILGIVIALFIATVLVIKFSWESVAKKQIAAVISPITGTPVSIGGLSISPFSGSLQIDDFIIGAPEGYKSEYSLKLGKLFADVNLRSLLSDKIIVEEITVDGLHVIYDTTIPGFGSNLSKIKSNVDKYTESKKEKTEEKKPAEEEKEVAEEEGTSKKIIIEQLNFTNGKISVSSTLIGGKQVSIPLAAIHLKDLGKESNNGTEIAEVIDQILTAIMEATAKAVDQSGNLIESGKGIINDAGEKASGVIDDIKKIF
jgi:uncharacterized protein involved in outer membrane biogenesis